LAADVETTKAVTGWAPSFRDGTAISFSLKCSDRFPYREDLAGLAKVGDAGEAVGKGIEGRSMDE